MEKVIIVGVEKKSDRASCARSLEELGQLVEAAGGLVHARFVQRVQRLFPATLIGKGKTDIIRQEAVAHNIPTIILNEELSPAQQRNLENLIPAKIIDRTRLILDIFARRARTREGELQVELAQLSYLLPRLTGKGVSLSRQVGGIGTKGPGERELEYERRRIRDRIAKLKTEIDRIRRERETQRKKRFSIPFPLIAIIGYTNAGKSTLLNTLTGGDAGVYTDDKPFATLDPTTRRVKLPSGGWALFSDTVGFIEKLPHSLVAAFRATLEEVTLADCLLHIADVTSNRLQTQLEAVQQVLRELGAGGIPQVLALNKADMLSPEQKANFRRQNLGGQLLSAKTGEAVTELLATVEEILAAKWAPRAIEIEDRKAHMLKSVHLNSQVVKQTYSHGKYHLEIRITDENWRKLTHQLNS